MQCHEFLYTHLHFRLSLRSEFMNPTVPLSMTQQPCYFTVWSTVQRHKMQNELTANLTLDLCLHVWGLQPPGPLGKQELDIPCKIDIHLPLLGRNFGWHSSTPVCLLEPGRPSSYTSTHQIITAELLNHRSLVHFHLCLMMYIKNNHLHNTKCNISVRFYTTICLIHENISTKDITPPICQLPQKHPHIKLFHLYKMQHYLMLISKDFRFFLSKIGTIITINNHYWKGPAKFSLIFLFHNYFFSTEYWKARPKHGRQQLPLWHYPDSGPRTRIRPK